MLFSRRICSEIQKAYYGHAICLLRLSLMYIQILFWPFESRMKSLLKI